MQYHLILTNSPYDLVGYLSSDIAPSFTLYIQLNAIQKQYYAETQHESMEKLTRQQKGWERDREAAWHPHKEKIN